MATKINQLQVKQAKFDSNRMIDLNHWGKNMMIKPEVFRYPTRTLFASKTTNVDLSKGNILESLFGLGKTKYIDDLTWNWTLEAAGYRPITILENRTTGDTPGKYRANMEVLVDADLGVIGESWSPGSSDKSQVVIIKNKVPEGRGFLYTLQLYTDGPEHYLRKEYLTPGTQWTRMFNMRGEASESGSGSESTTNIDFHNNLVKLRKSYKVTDFGAQANVLEIAIKGSDNKVRRSWMSAQEADYYQQMNREMTLHALYSRLGGVPIPDPDSGFPIIPGAGLQQQIEFGGQIERFTTFSAELIENFFDRIVYSRVSPGNLGEVIGTTGHYGMKMFSKAIDTWSQGKSIVRDSNVFIKGDKSGVHDNSLKAGYQFTSFSLPNGGSFKLIYNPLNDDRSVHRDIDPLTGYPLESQRITLLDATGGGGESLNPADNIRLVRKNKVFGTTIVEGRYGPGGSISSNPKHSGDYYSVDITDSIGIEITDASGTGELIKTVD